MEREAARGQRRPRRRLPLISTAVAAAVHVCRRGGARPSHGAAADAFTVPRAPGRPPASAPGLAPAAAAASGLGAHADQGLRRRGHPRPHRALPEALSFVTTFLEEVPHRVAELGPLGPLYYFFVYVVAELLAVPATPMTLTAGYLFGAPLGATIALLAGSTSASIGFVLCRTFLQPVVARLAAQNELYRRINKAVEREGFKIIFLLRLSPLLPFSMSNYFFSLSSVRFVDYVSANLLGFAPATIAYVYLATAARSVILDQTGASWVAYALGAAVTLLLLRQATQVAKRAVDEAVEADEAAERRSASAGA